MEKPYVTFTPERLNTWGSLILQENALKRQKNDRLLQLNCTINFDDFDILAADSIDKFK